MTQDLLNSSVEIEIPHHQSASEPVVQASGVPLWLVILVPLAVFLCVDGISPSGVYPAVAALFCLAILLGLGYSVLRVFALRDQSPDLLLVSPASGLLVASAAAYLAATYGVRLDFLFVGILALALPGLFSAMRVLTRCGRTRVPNGIAIMALLAAIALVYFLPVSLRDAVQTPDGGYQWIYIDSVYHQSMVSMVLTHVHPVPDPGFAREGLAYHFGPNALAAVFAKVLNLTTADAWVRVMRLSGLLSLVGAVIAFGLWTAPRRLKSQLTIIFALFFVFFACSTVEVFATHWDASGHLPTHVSKFALQLGDLFYADIYKDTFFFGSGLWAQVLLFTVAGLLVRGAVDGKNTGRNPGAELLLAPLGISSNSLAGLSAVGVVVATYILVGRKSWRNSILVLGTVLLCYGMLTAGSFAHGVSSFISGISTWPDVATKLIDLLVWLALLFSTFKILAFLSRLDGRRIIFTTLALFTLGWIGFYLAVHLDANGQVYALLFLTSLVSGYAAGPATSLWLSVSQDDPGHARQTSDGFGWLSRLSLWGVGLGAVTLAFVIALAPSRFRIVVVLGLTLFLAMTAGIFFVLSKRPRSNWPSKSLLALVAVLVLLSALGSLRVAWNLGWNGMGTTISLDGGRVRSLLFLHEHSPQDAVVATAHLAVPEIPQRPARSYAYGGLSGRRMLLEGWEYREFYAFDFREVKSDNETLFGTSDAAKAEEIAAKYGIAYILTEPSDPFHFDPSSASWLRPIPNPGTLGIWKVVPRATAVKGE